MKLYYLFILTVFLMWGCDGQETGRLEQREAHYEVHERMVHDLQELERRHSNLKHEHDQWVISRTDTVPNSALRSLEKRHSDIEARHTKIIGRHHKLMEEHRAFFDTRDDNEIPKDEWRARYKKVEGEHEQMEKEHKQMREDHEKMKDEHRDLEKELTTSDK